MRSNKNIIFWGLMVLLSVSGCSSMLGLKDENPDIYSAKVAARQAAIAQGIGEHASFAATDQSIRHLQAAPSDQTYYFDFDKAAVKKDYVDSIDSQAKYLLNTPNAQVVLEGNTDIRGSREYNVALGENRAERVAKILKLNGVSTKQIRVVSYGAEKPAALGTSEDAYRVNRRVNLKYEQRS